MKKVGDLRQINGNKIIKNSGTICGGKGTCSISLVELRLSRGKKNLAIVKFIGFIGVSRFSVLGQMISDIEIFMGSDVNISFAKPAIFKDQNRSTKYRKRSYTVVGTINNITGKYPSLLEACFDLILSPSPSMKIQIMGGKITENLGFKSPLRKIKKCYVFFLFIFKFSIRNCISLFLAIFEYLVLQIILLFNGRIIT